ncbi:hypothetical protein HanRHA438_Chr17g0818201 [Helianthus annuus]|uniref:Uncharacterized protein n=1 Tax=Helianthus annuus TaxID=4232 RepID=A0A251RQU8_HELAN|nr:hypothetical protein HanXRQr2_Chr17g0808451 [Helianthus annuus]KAF5812653.1 hypothetical protein HanXRQr2_Chr03g0088921 [Helianthus annuus]KAJ0429540.1 hypothetical protein HanHA300_Chr17g0658551 [Helianthus annuus]KAJ0447927.1 hypothetical protein HanHA89_Chr17g0710941 [Helianthus annuus]KAJ0606473.1 hypothetical protein HanHA89_Chr03g0085531 [Helianthus annuus]
MTGKLSGDSSFTDDIPTPFFFHPLTSPHPRSFSVSLSSNNNSSADNDNDG